MRIWEYDCEVVREVYGLWIIYEWVSAKMIYVRGRLTVGWYAERNGEGVCKVGTGHHVQEETELH